MMIKALLIILTYIPLASEAFQYNLNSMLYQSSNPDELVVNDGVGEDIVIFENNFTAKKRLKGFFKSRLTSKTALNFKLANLGDAYEEIDFVNKDDANTSLRNLSLTQDFTFVKKASKNVILSLGIDFEVSKGYSIAQEFSITEPVDVTYHIIEDEYVKGKIDLGIAFRILKKNTLKLKYKFTEFDHENQYTFSEEQGTNDRRIHTIAVQDKQKINKSTFVTLAVQVDDITYKDRLSLDSLGFFQLSGNAEASTIQDQKLDLGLSLLKSSLKVNITKKKRLDKVDNGDGSDTSRISATIKKKWKPIELKLFLSYGEKGYTSQLDDQESEKRKDIISSQKLTLSFDMGGSLKNSSSSIFVEQRRFDSNNSFGEYNNNRAGIALTAKY